MQRGKHRGSKPLVVRGKQSYTPQHLLRASLCDRPEQQLTFLRMPWVTMKRCNEALGQPPPGGRTGASGRPPSQAVKAKTQVQGLWPSGTLLQRRCWISEMLLCHGCSDTGTGHLLPGVFSSLRLNPEWELRDRVPSTLPASFSNSPGLRDLVLSFHRLQTGWHACGSFLLLENFLPPQGNLPERGLPLGKDSL